MTITTIDFQRWASVHQQRIEVRLKAALGFLQALYAVSATAADQGVTLARNVGYLSIGHGYYLEDGTETDNKFYSNIGIFARAAVNNDQNPRKVPGILGGEPARRAEICSRRNSLARKPRTGTSWFSSTPIP